MTYPDRVAATVTVGGVDVTDKIRPGSFQVNSILTRQVDTLKMNVDGLTAQISDWLEVIFTDGALRSFAGYVITPKDEAGADLLMDCNLSASDYSVRLEKVRVKKQYLAMTDKAIIADLFATYLPTESWNVTTYVHAIRTHEKIRFNRVTLLDCIKQLCTLSGADFYVDYYKNLHYFANEVADAPFAVSDAPNLVGSFPYSNFSVSRDGSGVINRLEVIGGNYLSADAEFYIPGAGKDKRVSLPFKLHAPDGYTAIRVYRNDGTLAVPVWTPLTVKTGYIDTLAGPNEVLFYYQEKVLEQQANWPALANACLVYAKYEVPLRIRLTSQASYAHYGMWFDDQIANSDYTTRDIATQAGKVKMAESEFAKTAISFTTVEPGLRSGQLIHVTNALHGVDADYLIQKVSTTIGINGAASYGVSVGVYAPDLADILMMLAKKTETAPVWNEDEVMDEILQVFETMSSTEAFAISQSSPPYYISPNSDAAIIGFSSIDP